MKKPIFAGLCLALLLHAGCKDAREKPQAAASTDKAVPPVPKALRFLALGDSYTIGEGVPPAERWPMQLVAALGKQNIHVAEPTIIARTGWTTSQLSEAIGRAQLDPPYDLVSLLIGVNNQYRGGNAADYRPEFVALLKRSIELAGGDADRVLVLSIPDYGVTPFARRRDPKQVAAAIDSFNAVNREETIRLGARYIDVTPISRRAADEPDLLAADGLHPSGKMYGQWVELMTPLAIDALSKKAAN